MKKILLLTFSAALFYSVSAQNIQLHYDFGENRKFLTSTVEMFKPDSWGSTFFFIDMDYSSDSRNAENGVLIYYWELELLFN